jgi:hypothetical protein
MKRNASQLNALIKIHKTDQPIRTAVNNIRAPSYKLAKHLNKKLKQTNTTTIYIHHKKTQQK